MDSYMCLTSFTSHEVPMCVCQCFILSLLDGSLYHGHITLCLPIMS